MSISIHLPADMEETLREKFPNLEQTAKETLLIELYRRDFLSHAQLANALQLSRFQTDALLHEHGISLDLTINDIEHDAASSRVARGG